MIFSSFEFLVFFALVWVVSTLIKNKMRLYHIFLLLASYYFYMCWNPYFIVLILFTSVLDFYMAKKIEESDEKRKKWLIIFSLVSNFGLIFIFKYANFAFSSLNGIFHLVGSDVKIPHYDITLPVGISFFTFQSLSYTLDVYRGNLKAEKSIIKFLLFVAYFPQLVAGPIVRASDFLPQLQEFAVINKEKIKSGIKLFVLGFFKKLLISDMIAPYSDNVFSNIGVVTSYEAWLGIIAYTIQIYCDFSGYSDMAIGVARTMGYEFVENFNMPYRSLSITEFWRRWHISLSTWLRDYLYISLGGNRQGKLKTYANLMITMLLGGLWHGANWTFVVWGGLHGVLLSVHKVWSEVVKRHHLERITNTFVWNTLAWAMTLASVMLSWIFFRAESFTVANQYIHKLFAFRMDEVYIMPQFLLLVSLVVVGHLGAHTFFEGEKFKRSKIEEYALYSTMLLLLVLLAPTNTSPFIYFQF